MTKDGQATAVQVALRIRPLTDRDRAQPRFAKLANDDVLKLQDKTVQVVSQNKYFSFDHVFGTTSTQEDVFAAVGDNLIRKFIEGYNITVLAYGQTSSGKTHTMGTASVKNSMDEGIVPRSMTLLFDLLQGNTRPASPALSVSSSSSTSRLKSSRASKTPSFLSQPYNSRPVQRNTVTVSFIEIYNEDLHDLLSSAPPEESPPITIREDTKGNIYWTGVKEVQVQSAEDVLYFLEQGTQNRATGATDMNEKSSRSHAIFSVTLRQEKANEPKKSTSSSRAGSRPASSMSNRTRASHTPKGSSEESERTITVSKFHFVDLAGSERLKRTAAEGDRRKEGININAGLLALGNVISALASDSARKKLHIPYRDSKLTRLLQDSLGGNATTVMIACVSPAEYNLAETLNTLQYASRARSIKNRSEKNEVEEWMTTDNLELLRSLVGKLKHELRYLNTHSKTEESDNESDDDSLEQRLLIADLQRQVEELDGEASVTRERNRVVERELHRLRVEPKKEDDFQHLVEPVIEEYEKSITSLESQLALTKAALNCSDLGFEEQQSKIQRLESLAKSHEHSTETLRTQLAKLTERDQSNESYILELENKLMVSSKDSLKDQAMLTDLKTRIAKLKETDENTEQYIHDLERRLATAEALEKRQTACIEDLEAKVDARERSHLELLKKIAQPAPPLLPAQPNDDSHWREQITSLENERDALKHQLDLASVTKPVQSQSSAEPLPRSANPSRRTSFPSQTLADEQAAVDAALAQANAQLAQTTERSDRLQQTLDRLQSEHQVTLKELDEALQRYHEAVEQLDFMDHSRASSTTHEEDSAVLDLSKEMAIAKEAEEKQAYLGQISQLQAQLGRQEKEQQLVLDSLRQDLAHARTQLTVQAEQRAAAHSQTQQTIETLEDQVEALHHSLEKKEFDQQQELDTALKACQNQLIHTLTTLDNLKATQSDLERKHLNRQQQMDQLTRSLQELTLQHESFLSRSAQAREAQQAQHKADLAAQQSLLQHELTTQHQQTHASLTRQIQALESDLLTAQKDSNRHLALLDAAREESLQERDRFGAETADLSRRLEQSQRKLELQQAEEEEIQAALDEECQRLRAELTQLRAAMANTQDPSKGVSEKGEGLERSEPKVTQARDVSDQAQSLHQGREIEEKDAELDKLRTEISQLKQADSQKQRQLEKESKAKEETEKTLEKVRFELAKSKKNNSINFVYEDRIQQLEKQLAQKSEENAEYTSLSEELEKEIGRISQEQEKLAQTLAQAQIHRTEQRTLIDAIKQSLQLSSSTDSSLLHDIQHCLHTQTQTRPSPDTSPDLSSAAVNSLKKQNKSLSEQLQTLEKTIQELQTNIQADKNTISELQAEKAPQARDDIQTQLSAAEQSLENEKARADKAERINLKLEKQIEDLLKSKRSFMCF